MLLRDGAGTGRVYLCATSRRPSSSSTLRSALPPFRPSAARVVARCRLRAAVVMTADVIRLSLSTDSSTTRRSAYWQRHRCICCCAPPRAHCSSVPCTSDTGPPGLHHGKLRNSLIKSPVTPIAVTSPPALVSASADRLQCLSRDRSMCPSMCLSLTQHLARSGDCSRIGWCGS